MTLHLGIATKKAGGEVVHICCSCAAYMPNNHSCVNYDLVNVRISDSEIQ